MTAKGELHGKQVQPRDLASLAYNAGITDADDLSLAVMICLAESQGYDRAFNDNLDASGNTTTRDVGLWQINIPANAIGTQTEEDLYDHQKNALAMVKLFSQRHWQPWVAYDTGVCFHDTYLQRGCNGVLNFLVAMRVENAKVAGTYQATPVPLFSIKELPYYKATH